MRSPHKFYQGYLFWIGLDLLGGAFRRLVSTDFLASSMASSNLFEFAEKELTKTRSLLGWFLSLGQIFKSYRSDSKEHTRISKQNKAKRVNKALLLLLMLVFGWKENEIDMVDRWNLVLRICRSLFKIDGGSCFFHTGCA